MKLFRKFMKFCCFLSCCCRPPAGEEDETEQDMEHHKVKEEKAFKLRKRCQSCPNLMRSDSTDRKVEMKKWKSQNFAFRKRLRKKKQWKPIPHRQPTPFRDHYKSPREGTSRELLSYLDYLATFCRPLEADNEFTQAFELEWIMGYERFEWAYRYIYRNTYAEVDY